MFFCWLAFVILLNIVVSLTCTSCALFNSLSYNTSVSKIYYYLSKEKPSEKAGKNVIKNEVKLPESQYRKAFAEKST